MKKHLLIKFFDNKEIQTMIASLAINQIWRRFKILSKMEIWKDYYHDRYPDVDGLLLQRLTFFIVF